MSLETKIEELIATIGENTLALRAFNSALSTSAASVATGEVKRTRTPKAAAAAVVEVVAAPAAAVVATTAATKGVTANDLKKFVKDERTRLKDVSDEAVKAHKEASAKILKSFGLEDFTAIPEDKAGEILAKFKALNVEKPQLELVDELDDDGDGLD